MPKEKKKLSAIEKYERRWIKPTVITLIVLALPFIYLGLRHGPTVVTAMTQYDASFKESVELTRRDDKDYFYNNTPKVGKHPIAKEKSDLPKGPVLISFYLKHCPYCEAAHGPFEEQRRSFIEDYPEYKDRVVYVDVTSPLGQDLIRKYDVNAAASLLVVDGEHSELLPSAGNDPEIGIAPNYENIVHSFEKLLERLEMEP